MQFNMGRISHHYVNQLWKVFILVFEAQFSMTLEINVNTLSLNQGVAALMHFSVAFSKNSILGFCHLPIKHDPLNPKMAFLFGFEAPGRHRRHLQIGKLKFCSFVTSPLAPLACLTKIPGDPGRTVQPVGFPKNSKNTISQFVNDSYASQGP